MNDSIKKIKNRNAFVKCKGIEELTEMDISEQFESIQKLTASDNSILKIIALKGCIKLNPKKGLYNLSQSEVDYDNWTQLNIIDILETKHVEHVKEIDLLLTSGNHSIISLGLKIIHHFHLSDRIVRVSDLSLQTSNLDIRNEAIAVLYKLTNTQ